MKHNDILFLATAVLGTFGFANSASIDGTITISSGTILGNPRHANGALSFKGIPYAAPLIGDLRWKSPQPPVPFANMLNATQCGASCYVSTTAKVPYFTPPSENCLFLNVWTAAPLSTKERPVMVFIPGAGFQFGSAAHPTHDGSNLANEGVVVVTLNYRLGVSASLDSRNLMQKTKLW